MGKKGEMREGEGETPREEREGRVKKGGATQEPVTPMKKIDPAFLHHRQSSSFITPRGQHAGYNYIHKHTHKNIKHKMTK